MRCYLASGFVETIAEKKQNDWPRRKDCWPFDLARLPKRSFLLLPMSRVPAFPLLTFKTLNWPTGVMMVTEKKPFSLPKEIKKPKRVHQHLSPRWNQPRFRWRYDHRRKRAKNTFSKRSRINSTQYLCVDVKTICRLTRTLTSLSSTLPPHFSPSSYFGLWCRLFCMPRWWKIWVKVDPTHCHAALNEQLKLGRLVCSWSKRQQRKTHLTGAEESDKERGI